MERCVILLPENTLLSWKHMLEMIASNHKENVWLEPGLNEEWETHGLKLMKGWERPGRLRRASEGFEQKEALGVGLKDG